MPIKKVSDNRKSDRDQIKSLKFEKSLLSGGYFQLQETLKKLKESEYFFRESQQAASVGSYKADFIVDSWESSEVLDKIFGIDQKYKMSIQGWLEIIHPDDRKMMTKYLSDEIFAKHRPFNKEYRIQRKSNRETRWVLGLGKCGLDKNGKTSSLIGTIQDITERKKMEQQLRETQTRDESILNSIGDAVFASDINGNILIFNKVAEELTGISAKKAIGSHYSKMFKFVKEGDVKLNHDFIAEAIKNNAITKMTNHTMLVRNDGFKISVADSAAPIKNDAGETIGCVVVFRDVTKERQIDKAKTEFVSLASHQLRTPLSTINWYSEMLLSEDVGPLAPKQRQYAREIYHASQRMVSLVNSLLNASRLELGTFAIEPELVNVIKLVQACLNELNPQILAKNLVIKQKFEKNTPSIVADPKLIVIIIQNFLTNSIKYSNRSGGEIIVTIKKMGEDVLVAVSDNGIGIPKYQQEQVFEKLFRADNAKIIDSDGSGLGLYIVQEIIHYTGGKTWFESGEGKGSTFYASLPISGMQKKHSDKKLI